MDDKAAFEHLLAGYVDDLEVDRFYRSPDFVRSHHGMKPDVNGSFKIYGQQRSDGSWEYFWKDWGIPQGRQHGYRPLHLAMYLWREFDYGKAKDRLRYELKYVPRRARSSNWNVKDPATSGVLIEALSDYEIAWWADYDVRPQTLKLYDVYSTARLYHDQNYVLHSTRDCPAFTYVYDRWEPAWQVYRPDPKLFWSKNLQHCLGGWHQLPWQGQDLVFASGYKDGLCIYESGDWWLAPGSESAWAVIAEKLPMLSKRFRRLYSLFDNDKTGITAMSGLEEESHGIVKPLYLDWPLVFDTAEKRLRQAGDAAEVSFFHKKNYLTQLIYEAKCRT